MMYKVLFVTSSVGFMVHSQVICISEMLFGSKNEKGSFRSEWCEKYSWLHCDVSADATFCYIYTCMMTEREKK